MQKKSINIKTIKSPNINNYKTCRIILLYKKLYILDKLIYTLNISHKNNNSNRGKNKLC